MQKRQEKLKQLLNQSKYKQQICETQFAFSQLLDCLFTQIPTESVLKSKQYKNNNI